MAWTVGVIGDQPRRGSYTAQLATASPAIRAAITSAWSATLAASLRAAATTFAPISGPGDTRRPISSATMQASTSPSPEMLSPPAAGSMIMEFQPSSLPRFHQSGSKPMPLSASSRTRVSGISFSRNSLVVARNSFWSAVRSKSIR